MHSPNQIFASRKIRHSSHNTDQNVIKSVRANPAQKEKKNTIFMTLAVVVAAAFFFFFSFLIRFTPLHDQHTKYAQFRKNTLAHRITVFIKPHMKKEKRKKKQQTKYGSFFPSINSCACESHDCSAIYAEQYFYLINLEYEL